MIVSSEPVDWSNVRQWMGSRVGVFPRVLALTGVAFAISLVLEPWIGLEYSPVFLGAVALSARRYGKRAGIVSALLTMPALLFMYLPPHPLRPATWAVGLRLLSFLCTAALMVWLVEKFLAAQEGLVRSLDEVRTREERFRVAVRKMSAVVFQQDAELRYIWAYNTFPEHEDGSFLNKLDSDLFPEAEAARLTRIKRAVLDSGVGRRTEVEVTGRAGRRIMDVTVEPFKNHQGDTVGLLGTAVDITEHKIHEARLRQSGEQFRSLAWRLHAAHEDRRALTSREIHDNVSQILAAVDLELATIAKMVEGGDDRRAICDRLRATGASLSTTIETSERISAELRPSLLDNLGLASAIESEAREFQARTGVSVLTSHLERAALAPETATAVFRIVQEALARVEGGGATIVTISLRKGFAGLVLQIRDNGRDRTAGEGTDPESLRLLGMREMAGSFGGKVTVQEIRGRGTTLWVEIPVRPALAVPESCP
jgi:two-component system sensor histidine kinase UhpB